MHQYNQSNKLFLVTEELALQYKEQDIRSAALVVANKELHYQNKEKGKRAAELVIADKELTFQKKEKKKRADELLIANKELGFQNKEKGKRAAELVIANKELRFQNREKENRAAELKIANKELLFQNKEKEKRAAELIIANKELRFQNSEKENRAAELKIANKELLFQNKEKENRAAELIVINKELSIQIEERQHAENSLKQSEFKYRQIVETAQEGIWMLDEKNKTTFVNQKMCTILEYAQEEIIGKENFYFMDDAGKKAASKTLARRKKGIVENIELRFVTKNGKHIWANLSANPILDMKGKYQGALAMVSDITEKKQLQQQLLNEQISKLKEITKAVESAQEKERSGIGEELHDNVNQLLAASKLYLKHSLENPGALDAVSKSIEYITTAMEELRKLSHALVGPSKQTTAGLIDTINSLIADIIVVKDIKITFLHSTYMEGNDDTNFKLIIYRIIQEQLSNILKYAEAAEIIIEIKKEHAALTLSIADNGKGFNTKTKRTGIGLKNIARRAEVYNGIVTTISSPGKGCTMKIVFTGQ